MPKITEFLSSNDQWVPMVCADKARIDSLRPIAQELSNKTGKPVKLARFHIRDDVQTLTPKDSRRN